MSQKSTTNRSNRSNQPRRLPQERVLPTVLTSGGGAVWGGISGTLSSQADLSAALSGKQAAGSYQPLATALTNTTAAFTTAQETKLAGLTGLASGTSFPGSPATGDLYYRSDRHIEYFYDGTRWLSTQLLSINFGVQEGLLPNTTSTSQWAANPHNGEYDIYVEKFKVAWLLTTATTSVNYFAARLSHSNPTGAANTSMGAGISAVNNTQNHWTMESETVNAVIPSTAIAIYAAFTETGTASTYQMATMTYRLVG